MMYQWLCVMLLLRCTLVSLLRTIMAEGCFLLTVRPCCVSAVPLLLPTWLAYWCTGP